MDLTRRNFLRAAAGASAAAPLLTASSAPAAEPEAAAPAPAAATTRVSFTVNGLSQSVDVGVDEPALAVVRDRLGLRGTKQSCGHGACGACTIHVDGTPKVSCLLPAAHLEGADVRTIEGLGRGPAGVVAGKGVTLTGTGAELHPVQRAFLANDALQCGYCTPGFIMAASAFHDTWRSRPGPREEPGRAEIAAALAGHLCRCGAYDAIYDAVAGACAGRYDAPIPAPARPDGLEKVTGAARYTVDVSLPGQLIGRFLRSPNAHARVTAIDFGPARAVPGVKAVHPMIEAGGKVRYVGQELAAIAAVDATAAEAGARAIRVTYEILPAVFDLEAARKDGAPTLYGKGDKPPSASEGPVLGSKWNGNERGPVTFNYFAKAGKAQALVEAPPEGSLLVTGRWTTQAQCHTTMEPHAFVAHWQGEKLEAWASTQGVHALAEDLAERFDLKPEQVLVHAQYVGGAFGGKAGFEPLHIAAVELSRAAGAPVAMVYDRAEELGYSAYRAGQAYDLAVVAGADGSLEAMTATGWGNAGVAVGTTSAVNARLTYPVKEKSVADYDVVTNLPPGKPFRAPGGPSIAWAMEQLVDEVAYTRGEDPLTLRRRWDPNDGRQRLYKLVAELPMWTERGPVRAGTGRYVRGVGLATGTWPYFADTRVEVALATRADGLTVTCAAQDMGNGTRAVLREGVLRVFGLPPETITVEIGDSAGPRGPLSAGSRTTASLLPAATDAATQLADVLTDDTAARLALANARPTAEGVAHDGGVVPWSEVLATGSKRTTVGRRKKDEASWFLPISVGGLRIGRVLTGAVQVTEVEVDTWLGKVRVTRVWAGYSAGRIATPQIARSQAAGGIVQGIGYALYEERRNDPRNGHPLTIGMEDYRVPGIGDIPPLDIHWDEIGLEWVNGGGVGLAELVTVPVAASIGNAVYHATGWRPRELPIRPDRVLAGLARRA